MKSLRQLFVQNATANMVQLAANSLVGIILPPILVHHLPHDVFSAWTLVLQISLYLSYLDLGIQSAIAYFVAFSESRADLRARNRYVSSAFGVLSILAVAGVAGMVALAFTFRSVFAGLPQTLAHDARNSLTVLAFSSAILLPTSVFGAVFVGQQRNHIPALIAVFGRTTSAFLIAIVVLRQLGLIWMAGALGIANLCVGFLLVQAWRRYAPDVEVRFHLMTVNASREILKYSYGLMIWTASGLLISGLDTVIVGAVDFGSVAYYGIAAMVTTFLIQFQGAVMRALVPTASILHSREDAGAIQRLLQQTTRYGTLLLLWTGVPLIVLGQPILRIWLGAQFATRTFPLLVVLVVANIVRLTCLPYATVVLGVNQQNRIAYVGLAEGIINVVVSVVLGREIGAAGVALGTLVGAAASVVLHFWYSMPRTKTVVGKRTVLALDGLLVPLLVFIPWIGIWEAGRVLGSPSFHDVLVNLACAVLAAIMSWRIVLREQDKTRVVARLWMMGRQLRGTIRERMGC